MMLTKKLNFHQVYLPKIPSPILSKKSPNVCKNLEFRIIKEMNLLFSVQTEQEVASDHDGFQESEFNAAGKSSSLNIRKFFDFRCFLIH